MKKSFRIMAASCALLLTFGVLAGAAQAGMNTDLNGDGAANRSDAAMLVDALLGKSSARMTKDMDQNSDGRIDASDLSVLKNAILFPQQESGREPKLPATMYSNFRSGDAGDFFASDGWTNGKPFDCWWYKQNAQIKGDHLELTISDNYQNKGNSDWQPSYSGGEFRTEKYYHYGYYETSMKAIKNDGVVSSFFTYTGPSDVINGQKNPWDEIDIEILGKDTTKVQLNYYRNGQGGHEKMIDLGFDASEGYHTYGFDWQPDKITWYVDGKEVYSMSGDVPKTPSKIRMNAWPGKTVDDWLKAFNGNKPLTASYEWVTYQKASNANAIDPSTLEQLEAQGQGQQGQQGQQGSTGGQEPDLPATMYSNFRAGEAGDFFSSDGWTNGEPFDCWWYKQNAQIKGDHLELTISDNYQNKGNSDWQPNYSGGEFRTDKYYHYGYYETSMKAIKNDGVVSSFFTYTGPSDVINGQKNPWDEIDIEILGKDTTKMQINYYRNGKGGHEKMIDLGFDSSEAYHKYGFDWQPDKITWYVDGKKVGEMTGDMPKTPSKIMMNAWPGRNVNDWLKAYNGNKPLTASYEWVTYKKAENGDDPHTLDELEAIAKGGQGSQGQQGQQQQGQQGQQSSSGMNANATMVSNFSAGQAGDFFASDGWTNGKPFDCYWYKRNAYIQDGALRLIIDQKWNGNDGNTSDWQPGYSGGEFRTNNFYHYGYYETSMKAIKNDGVVSSFFTYTGPSDNNPWDEIDIEILGKDTTKVQLNYYRNGQGGHEKMIDLGFDSSQAFHRYGFNWQPGKITWYVDGKEVYSMSGDVPVTPSKIMMNAWPGKTVDDWLKAYNGNKPLTAYYQWVTYNKQ